PGVNANSTAKQTAAETIAAKLSTFRSIPRSYLGGGVLGKASRSGSGVPASSPWQRGQQRLSPKTSTPHFLHTSILLRPFLRIKVVAVDFHRDPRRCQGAEKVLLD